MIKRIIYICILLISLFSLPVWATGIFVFLGMIRFPRFFEAVCIVFLYESVFAPFSQTIPFIGTLFIFGVLVVIEIIRPLVRK